MSEEILFTLRLTPDDWDSQLHAWRAPAFGIPSAFIKDALDPKGKPIATTLLKVDKGPARLTWIGSGPPSQITVVVGLGEKLSPASQGQFWKGFAIVVPIITALIAAGATYLSSQAGSDPTPHTLRLRVDPNDIEASGLPPAKVTVNSREVGQPIEYKVESDVIAIVDVSKAIDVAKSLKETVQNQESSIKASITNLAAVFGQLDKLNAAVNGNICSGGSHGEPSPNRGDLSKATAAISSKLRGISSDLDRTRSSN